MRSGLQPVSPDPISRVHYEEGWRFTNLPTAARWFPRKWDAAVSTARIAEPRQVSLQKKESLMTALTPNIDHGSLLTRRSIIGAAASLLCAPAIVRVTNLMPVRRIILKSDHYYGFLDRLRASQYFSTIIERQNAGCRQMRLPPK
jgi:hypothetical protein